MSDQTVDRVEPKPKNYLVEAILVTIFCCQPFGIVAIVYAAKVDSEYLVGNHIGARESAKEAKKWVTWALVAGLAVIAVSVLLFFLGVFGAIFAEAGDF